MHQEKVKNEIKDFAREIKDFGSELMQTSDLRAATGIPPFKREMKGVENSNDKNI